MILGQCFSGDCAILINNHLRHILRRKACEEMINMRKRGSKLSKHPTSLLASYATFKELYNSRKYSSPYQILSEFIRFVIISKGLYCFTSTDIQAQLSNEFGFKPPIAVIRTATKSIDGLTLSRGNYNVDRNIIASDDDFKSMRQKSESNSSIIIDALIDYAQDHYGGNNSFKKEKLSQELIAFVLDEEGDENYHKLIGEFVIANSNNEGIKNTLLDVREGSILYAGLSYNISEFGSLRNPITLYLDTEILFDMAGHNGEVFKILADDFLSLVDTANKGGRLITLKYFAEVKGDIDKFYGRAENIVDGCGGTILSPAMKAIVTGCEDISDVEERRTEFFRKLHIEHSIRSDNKTNYYTDSDNRYNLEAELQDRFPVSELANYEGLRFCSHINKLRHGEQATDLLDSKYVFVTDTRRVQEISSAFAEEQKNQTTGERYAEYAVSLSRITNLLWYKLNRGFGAKEFPRNLDVVIKARVVLTNYIKQGVASTYKVVKEKFDNGELTADQAARYIVALRDKPMLPEELQFDNIEEGLVFSEEYLNSVAEDVATSQRVVEEKNRLIAEKDEMIRELNTRLSNAKQDSIEKQAQIDSLTDDVNRLMQIEKGRERNNKVWIARAKLGWAILWKLVIIAAVILVLWWICKWFGLDFPTWLGIILSAAGLIGLGIAVVRKDLIKYKERIEDSGV